jgi:hypothetical protein
MGRFLLGLTLGGLSGGITYTLTHNGQTATITGLIAAALTWLGIAALILADDYPPPGARRPDDPFAARLPDSTPPRQEHP